jgi:hypothetical protein
MYRERATPKWLGAKDVVCPLHIDGLNQIPLPVWFWLVQVMGLWDYGIVEMHINLLDLNDH